MIAPRALNLEKNRFSVMLSTFQIQRDRSTKVLSPSVVRSQQALLTRLVRWKKMILYFGTGRTMLTRGMAKSILKHLYFILLHRIPPFANCLAKTCRQRGPDWAMEAVCHGLHYSKTHTLLWQEQSHDDPWAAVLFAQYRMSNREIACHTRSEERS